MAHIRRMCCLGLLLVLVSDPTSRGQHQAPSRSGEAALAVPSDDGVLDPAILVSAGPRTEFHLQSSWIPGYGNKGMFRYKLSVAPVTSPVERVKQPAFYTPDAIAAHMRRMRGCDIGLVLYDSDGFLLSTVPMQFILSGDTRGGIVGLSVNSAEQMRAAEYRQFLKGSWSDNLELS
jgi:hypothetical protein